MSPAAMWDIADCIASYYPVTVGTGWQITETAQGSNGVSGRYKLSGGHETVLDAWFILNGRLGFGKSESWNTYPASKWPGKRVVLQTDDRSHMLYEGQGALFADELMGWRPELWAVGYPQSV